MADGKSPQDMFKGKKFNNYNELKLFMDNYQIETKTVYIIRDSGQLEDVPNTTKEVIETFVYWKIVYYCKFSDRNKPLKSKERKTSTYQLHYPSRIRIKLIDSQYFEVTSCQLSHKNHDESVEFFEFIPENRRLKPAQMKEVAKSINLDANFKKLQNDIEKEYGKKVSLKQLHNIRTKMRKDIENSGNLQPLVERLRNKYKADVSVYNTADGLCKGIYFSTKEMRDDFRRWPSIVMIDGTYKLTDRDLTLMLMVVEDSKGRGQVVSFGLLGTEEKDTLQWMLQSFKNEHGIHCNKIESFLTDKDLTERRVLHGIFPGVPTYICRYHVLKIFKKTVKSTSMNLSQEEQKNALTILQELCYATSDEHYNKLYSQLQDTCPSQLVDYYNANWHCIREEWTEYHMAKHNLGNFCNNRTESLNAKVKAVAKKYSPVLILADDLFEWYYSHKKESDGRTAYQFLKKKNTNFDENSCEQKYINCLTSFASDKVIQAIDKINEVNLFYCDNDTKECTIPSGENFLSATPQFCECNQWVSERLPCKHMFAARKYFKMPFCDETLIVERWRKSYLLKTWKSTNIESVNNNNNDDSALLNYNRTLDVNDESEIEDADDNFETEEDNENRNNTKTRTKKVYKKRSVMKKRPLTVAQKRKKLEEPCKKLLNFASLACGENFEKRLQEIILMGNLYASATEVRVVPIKQTEDIMVNNFQDLSLDSGNRQTSKKSVQQVTMSPKIVIRGRPSGYLKTTVTYKTKRH